MKYKHTKKQWIKWYEQKRKLMGETYREVTPEEFYRDLFPEGVLQKRGDRKTGRGNAMVDVITDYPNQRRYTRKYVMTDDLGALRYMNPEGKTKELSRMCLCSPVSYYGIHKSNAMAHELFAVVIDLDYVGIQQLKNVIKQIGNGARCIPPNYLVNSGRGLHLYYLLQEPVPCYRYMLDQLTKFKGVIEDFIWNYTTSIQPDKPDHGAITQAFRMVGSETKIGKEYVVRAYKVREQRWTVEELYHWIEERASLFLKDCPFPRLKKPMEVYREKHPLTIEQAKEKYPDWNPYQEKKKWTCKEDLYYWWIRQIETRAVPGGRYYALLALVSYGSKCDIPLAQIEKDAVRLVPFLETLTDDETNHFTEQDAYDAMSFYRNNKEEVTYKLTRARISELSKIDIPPNKRNYRKQAVHLKIARATLEIMNEDRGKPLQGRPEKAKIVEEWRKLHPEGKKADCIRETGLSKPTVYKWWKKAAYYTDPEEMRKNESSEEVTKSALTSDNQMCKRLRAYAEQFSLFEEEKG